MVSVRVSGMWQAERTSEDAPVVLAAVRGRSELEAEMVEAVAISWRLPSAAPASSPWASDGPWDQMLRDRNVGDYDARGGVVNADGSLVVDDVPAPRDALTREDMARIERAAQWLGLLVARPTRRGQTSSVSDGAIVAAVLRQKAAGRSQVDWAQVLRAVSLSHGKDGIAFRYRRAMEWLAERVAKG